MHPDESSYECASGHSSGGTSRSSAPCDRTAASISVTASCRSARGSTSQARHWRTPERVRVRVHARTIERRRLGERPLRLTAERESRLGGALGGSRPEVQGSRRRWGFRCASAATLRSRQSVTAPETESTSPSIVPSEHIRTSSTTSSGGLSSPYTSCQASSRSRMTRATRSTVASSAPKIVTTRLRIALNRSSLPTATG